MPGTSGGSWAETRDVMTQVDAAGVTPVAMGVGRRVVLVEDEMLVRDMVRVFLERAGYRVAAFESAEDALSERNSGRMDLLLTDVMLRGKTGVELAQLLRAQQPDLKVVYMSGNVADDKARDSVVSPDARFLAKPFTRTMLLAVVRALAPVDDVG